MEVGYVLKAVREGPLSNVDFSGEMNEYVH